MSRRRPTAWPRTCRLTPAMIAAALVLGLAGAEASASSTTIVAGHGPATAGLEHSRHCRCRMHCKTVCCCADDEPRSHTERAPSSVPSSTPTTPTDEPGSCFKPAPCGGVAIPGAAPVFRVGPPAGPTIEASQRPSTAGGLVPVPPADIPPSTTPARIDEPPESRVRT